MTANIGLRLDKARTDLLDLGLRNSLLNYKPPKNRGVEIVGAATADVFKSLVSDRASVSFTHEQARGVTGLPTRLDEEPLKRRLLATMLAANAHIEERGSNILFLALRMLHWFEDEKSNKELRAPLLLLPVELARTSARERFTLKVTEEDIEENLSLATKLLNDYGVRLADMPDVEDLVPNEWFDEIADAVGGLNRWKVEPDEISLGFFSFGKFLMYKDLDPEIWGLADEHTDAPALLSALLGDGSSFALSTVSEDEYLDSLITPDALVQVVDMDSSQALALLDIRAGRHLVIQGPPGTGKSQTIANVIADAVSQGRRVLFVAEKMAALDVVKRRLDKAGVGDACLELHSHTANKKALLHELRRTVQLGRPQATRGRFNLAQYTQLRDQLTAYCNAVNEPIGDSEYTPQQLMGELVAIRRALGDTPMPPFESVTGSRGMLGRRDVQRLHAPVAALQQHLGEMSVPARHPFRAARLSTLLPTDRQELEGALQGYFASCTEIVAQAQTLASFMGMDAALDERGARALLDAARRAPAAPQLRGVSVNTDRWQRDRDNMQVLLSTGQAIAALHADFDHRLIPEAWDVNLVHDRQVLTTVGPKWWRFLSSEYRRVRSRVSGLCVGGPTRDVTGQLKIVDAVMQVSRLTKKFTESEALGAELFGAQWRGQRSDWVDLGRINEWVVALHRDINNGVVLPGIVPFLAGDPAVEALPAQMESLEAAMQSIVGALSSVAARLKLGEATISSLRGAQFDKQAAQVRSWISAIGRLPEWIRYLHLRGTVQSAGLDWLLPVAHVWDGAAIHLVRAFQHRVYEDLLAVAYRDRQPLQSFSGVTQEQIREQFASLDRACFGATQLAIAQQHWQSLPRSGGHGQIGVLLREFEKRSRHLPIRKLMREAGNVIQTIKPVFMMSPMSIASFLPVHALEFDLVVFDEASQVKPVDAFGAVLRGKQLVVVGDSKQLPPTSFFDTLSAESDLEEDEDAPPSADMESILGLAAGQGVPQRMLRWHYRSRHESLIALSNKEFYDHRLVVFPSPHAKRFGLGLVFHHLKDTAYDRGRSRTNRKEAAAVATAVMQHARERPNLSLGVAAFSLAQADAIIDELELLRRADPVAEPYFAAHPLEPFFVKNLESVQGDERDVILISVGYGKDASGYLAMSFGALNGDGGERRLNVLITRARLSCEVFSSLTHDDIDLARTSSRGVACLKAFLKYAATGILDVPDAGLAEQDSVFEEQVSKALELAGHKVVPQVGSAGFRIDLAVVDPNLPGRYLLGIECDGAKYHSSRSARDRDRLREQVLVDLGWRIHRVWSTDWFADQDAELRRVLQAIEAAVASVESTRDGFTASTKSLIDSGEAVLSRTDPGIEPVTLSVPAGQPYVTASISLRLGQTELHEVPTRQLAGVVAQIVATESPVHVREVMRRIVDAVGVKRIGSRIEAALIQGIALAVRLGDGLRQDGDFLVSYPSTVVPRDRSSLPSSVRRVENVAPIEFEAAVVEVVRRSFGIRVDDLPIAVARLLGISRTSGDIVSAVISGMHRALQHGDVVADGDQLRTVIAPN